MWGATKCFYVPKVFNWSFNPRAPCGARQGKGARKGTARGFNPRAPCGARHYKSPAEPRGTTFQSTRPVWGATIVPVELTGFTEVSIHAPRVGRDISQRTYRAHLKSFNPRAPCGARPQYYTIKQDFRRFQSTRPVWGATIVDADRKGLSWFQSTRPVWGATATGVTTSPFCHVFMGIPLHKYDFLGT